MKNIKAFSSYEEAIEAERKREKFARQTRQGAFEASFVSFDGNKELYYPLAAVISSRAKDDVKLRKEIHAAYSKAYKRVLRQAPECLEVFKLIIKNGKERQKSIWAMVNKIKKQSCALKKTRSTPSKKTDTNDTAQESSGCSALKLKTTEMTQKKVHASRWKMSQKFRSEKS